MAVIIPSSWGLYRTALDESIYRRYFVCPFLGVLLCNSWAEFMGFDFRLNV